ncbi:[LSU ribosomal protein L11P]-lysine N-methyltransferase [Candidatus Electrothrix aarhusensis]|jgi:ribosomal protein L11 methyltransferase|uniref:Ribosomal protein L11 methyltransferase n=1 Tax=Candidatus Electrothrix aarhusensis TaxID=1859131 RepID=A0A444IUU3_9BACT|nr:[LSU ribosomal protein L11P]-lysine N-methyltransferase [Candidatus Electrothrix aarhusensis]
MDESLAPMWLKTSLDCPEITLEAVVDLLGVLSGSAVEQTPVKDGQSLINGFFCLNGEDREAEQDDVLERLEQELNDLFALYELEPPKPKCSVLADEDWATSWQQFFTPFAIIPGLVIKPSWEEYVPKADEQVIEMDPGMAFGTGQHASTKLALELVRVCFDRRVQKKVLDIGTGTGILAMGATLFGAEQVIAIDNDPESVRVAGENIAHNALEGKITVSGDDLDDLTGSFDLVCANIIHDVLVEMAPAIAALVAEKGAVVLAGILQGEQEKNIIRLYEALGLSLQEARYEDEWVSLFLVR